MREIKFRAWTGSTMEYRVVVGQLGAFYVEGIDPHDTACMSPLNTKYSDQTPIMQYTGLKDKMGREIYHKDILQSDLQPKIHNGCVEWDDKVAAFFIIWDDKQMTYFRSGYGVIDDIKVIGNLYENPKLLEKARDGK